PGSTQNALKGVAVVSANDVWAVGEYSSAPCCIGPNQTLVEHWDGAQWRVVSTPSPGTARFYGVVAVGANDVWAVGEYYDGHRHANHHPDATHRHDVGHRHSDGHSYQHASSHRYADRHSWHVLYDFHGCAPRRLLLRAGQLSLLPGRYLRL